MPEEFDGTLSNWTGWGKKGYPRDPLSWKTKGVLEAAARMLRRGFPVAVVVDFDAKNNILRATLSGKMTGERLLEFYAATAKFMELHPPCRGILDFSAVTGFEVNSDAIRLVAAAPPVFPKGYMRILVVPKDFIYGMARMFQIITERTRPELQVVRTLDDAYLLLKVIAPEFRPLEMDLPPGFQGPS